MFADDLLMYLTNFEKSIPPLFKIISEYSLVSGYKINMDKTEVMAVGKHTNITQESQQSFKWTNSIKYLGCVISHNKQKIYKDHFIPLLSNMKSDLNKWMNLSINFTGRINLFKMTWLPKFCFLLFSTVPMTPPKIFFNKAYSIITDFIWGKKNI